MSGYKSLTIAIAALLLAGLAGHVTAQTAALKQCGKLDGTGKLVPNTNCPTCTGNCKFPTGLMYKTCEGAGTGCTNNVPLNCNGWLMSGKPAGQSNCLGTQVGSCAQPFTGC